MRSEISIRRKKAAIKKAFKPQRICFYFKGPEHKIGGEALDQFKLKATKLKEKHLKGAFFEKNFLDKLFKSKI
jgi:hypothetical protein